MAASAVNFALLTQLCSAPQQAATDTTSRPFDDDQRRRANRETALFIEHKDPLELDL